MFYTLSYLQPNALKYAVPSLKTGFACADWICEIECSKNYFWSLIIWEQIRSFSAALSLFPQVEVAWTGGEAEVAGGSPRPRFFIARANKNSIWRGCGPQCPRRFPANADSTGKEKPTAAAQPENT